MWRDPHIRCGGIHTSDVEGCAHQMWRDPPIRCGRVHTSDVEGSTHQMCRCHFLQYTIPSLKHNTKHSTQHTQHTVSCLCCAVSMCISLLLLGLMHVFSRGAHAQQNLCNADPDTQHTQHKQLTSNSCTTHTHPLRHNLHSTG